MIKARIDEIIATLKVFDDWNDRYAYLMELGDEAPELNVAFRVPENRIGCMATLYFYVAYLDDVCSVEFYCNGFLPRGLAAMIREVCNGATRADIYRWMPYLVKELERVGLPEHLTPLRREALAEMVKRITVMA